MAECICAHAYDALTLEPWLSPVNKNYTEIAKDILAHPPRKLISIIARCVTLARIPGSV